MVKQIYFQNIDIKRFGIYYSLILKLMDRLCKKVIIIPIPHVNQKVRKQSPPILAEILSYNGAITMVSGDATMLYINYPNDFMTDDAHITAKAHEAIYNKIRGEIWQPSKV